MPNIIWVGSPNFWGGRDGHEVVAICNHIMVGTMESTKGWFNNRKSEVSSQYGVAKAGYIHQYVSLSNTAWANGPVQEPDQSLDWLMQAIKNKVNPNCLTVSIEHEGSPGDKMPEAQYQATLDLHRMLLKMFPKILPDRKHIIGHYQMQKYEKANCPGSGFPWERLMNDLNQEAVFNCNPKNFSIGQGVKDILTANKRLAASDEVYFTPNPRSVPAKGILPVQHSFTMIEGGGLVLAQNDVDPATGSLLPSWSKRILPF
jgi:N-acetyl-anhydromuramyl-L-alanine amidase AmpD